MKNTLKSLRLNSTELSEANDDLDLTSSVNINFVLRCIPHVNKLKLEKLYVVGYFDNAKTKLYVGKIKSIEPNITIEFMEQQPNNKFVWKNKPKLEVVSSEQIIIGPLSVLCDHGITVNGLAHARERYIDYV